MTRPGVSRPRVRRPAGGVRGWEWAPTDRYRDWTWLAVLGTAAAAGMALVGLPPLDLHGPLH